MKNRPALRALLFLATFVTGVVINVDGGYLAAGI